MKRRTLPKDAKVFYKGKWVHVSDLTVEEVPKARFKETREDIAKRVIREITSSPLSSMERGELIKICEEVSREHGLKRRVNYRFLIDEGILGRISGSRRYYLTEKAAEEYPELFKGTSRA